MVTNSLLLKIFNLFIIGNQDVLRCPSIKRKLFDDLDSTLTQYTKPSVSSFQNVNSQYVGSPKEMKLYIPSKTYKAMNTSPSLFFKSDSSPMSSVISPQTKNYVQDLIELPSPRNSEYKEVYIQNAIYNQWY